MSQGPVTVAAPESEVSVDPELLDPLLLFVPEVLELPPELALPEVLDPLLPLDPVNVLLAVVPGLPLELWLPFVAEVELVLPDPLPSEEEPGEFSLPEPHAQNVAVAVATAKKARALISKSYLFLQSFRRAARACERAVTDAWSGSPTK
jgi:hypothetical protein